MADVVAAEAQINQQTQGRASQPQRSPGQSSQLREGDARFKRNLFINIHDTRVRTTEPQGRNARELKPTEVVLTKELKDQYVAFLDNYVQRLTEIDPALLRNENHRLDAELLSRLSEVKKDEQGREIPLERVPSAVKIEAFLKSAEGMMIAVQLLEYQTALQLYALGLKAFLDPRGERQMGLSRDRQITVEWDEGAGHRILFNHITPWLMRRVNQADERTDVSLRNWRRSGVIGLNAGLSAIPIIGGLVTGNPLIAAGAVLSPAATAFANVMRGGVQLHVQHVGRVLEKIKGDPNEVSYVKKMFGIDMDDFVVGVAGTVTLANRRGGTNDEQGIVQDMLGNLYTRFQTYHDFLKVPRNRIDAVPEQFLYGIPPPPFPGEQIDRRQEPRPEQMRVKWQQRVMDEFEASGGYVLGLLNVGENNDRYRKAQQKVMLQIAMEISRREMQAKTSERPIPIIEEMIKQRKENAEKLRNERGRQYAERKTTSETARTQLQTQREPLDAYQQALTTLQNTRGEARRAGNATTTTVEGIDVFIQDRNDFINNPARPGSIQTRRDALYTERRDWETIQGAALTAPVGSRLRIDQETKISEAADRRFQGRENELNKEEEKIRAQITSLENRRTAIETQERALEQNQSVVRTVEEQFIALQDNYNAITGIDTVLVGAATAAGIPGAAGLAVGLTENDLVTQPLDDLLARINSANAIGAAFPAGSAISIGWPAEQNNRPENRVILLQAIIEARARQIDPSIAVLGVELGTFLGQGITENQLRSLTSDQINEFANREFARTGGTLGWTPADNAALAPDMETAAQEAQNRFRVRLNAFDEERRILDEQVTQQTEALANINFDQEVRQLETTRDLLRREPEILSRLGAGEISADVPRFTNQAILNNANPDFGMYTPAEQAVAGPIGYYEIANLLFNYQQRADRNEYFQRIQLALSPQRMAEIFNNSLTLGIAAGPDFVVNILNQIRTQLDSHQLNTSLLIPGFRAIVTRLTNEALSIS